MNLPKENRMLHDAIATMDMAKLKEIIVNKEVGRMDLTLALPQAIMEGQSETVNYLIDHGADMHYFDIGGNRPMLVFAVIRGHIEVFRVLLANCRTINVEYNRGNLAHAAVRIRSLEVLKDLDKHHIKFLLFDKADDNNGRTPLHEAVYMLTEVRHVNLQNTEEPTSDSDSNNEEKYTVESYSYINDLEIVKFFLEHDGNVNTCDKRQRTPLHDAAKAGNMDITILLLNAGANRYVEDSQGYLPWMDAVISGFEKLADLLLLPEDFYKTLDKCKKHENNLFAAVAAKSMPCIQYLIKAGFNLGDPRLVNKERVSPLIKAIQHKEPHISALLVRFSADVINLKTSTRNSAMNYALDAWMSKNEIVWRRILDDLVKLGADINMYVGVHNVHILMQRDYLVNIWKLDWILSHSPNLNVKSKEGWSLFEIAVHHASIQRPTHLGLKVLIRLLNHGIRIPEAYRYHCVHNPHPWRGRTRKNRLSPTLEAMKGRHIVLAYVLHLIGCRTPAVDLQEWSYTYQSADLRAMSDPANELIEYIVENESSPLPLQDMARMTILDCFPQGNVKNIVSKLPIPVKLKERLDWEVFIDTKPKALAGYYKVIKEMLVYEDDENDAPEWEGFLFKPDVVFEL